MKMHLTIEMRKYRRTCHTGELRNVKERLEQDLHAVLVEVVQELLRCRIILRSLKDFGSYHRLK